MKRGFDLRAFAKINLDLRVLHKREDGYHEIRTVFQTISLADLIGVSYEPAAEVSIHIDGNADIPDNLIARAARLVTSELQCGGKFHFCLEKRIPMGAGLGGGSSDAAAVLMALPALIGKEIRRERLVEMAAGLGSDVPFFLYGGTAVGLGRGEELYPLPNFPPLPGILIVPDVHVSTAEAYRALSARMDWKKADVKRAEFARFAWEQNPGLARNDFEDAVFDMHPQLGQIRGLLVRSGAVCARMTGSGSAVFGLFESEEAADRARSMLEEYRAFPFSLLSRKRYLESWKERTTYPLQPELRA